VIRILIADDQQLVREGFRAILEAEDDIGVEGVAADGREAIALTRELSPDVVLMDVRMPGLDGIAATNEIMRMTNPPRVLMLTTFDLDEYVYEALKVGASRFLLKDAPRGRLAEAVRTVVQGDVLLDAAVTRRMVERFVRRPPPSTVRPPGLESLSDRELDVLRSLARGLSNVEIAKVLYLSPATVKTHVASILRKLDLRDRVQAVVLAYESGLLEPGAPQDAPTRPAPS
jgi:DNA-binding NarL/FixJ family response regulator